MMYNNLCMKRSAKLCVSLLATSVMCVFCLRLFVIRKGIFNQDETSLREILRSQEAQPASKPLNSSRLFMGNANFVCGKMPMDGRLGNHMFVYASTLGIAYSQSYTPVIEQSTEHFLKSLFHVTGKGKPEHIPWVELREQHAHAFDKRFMNLRSNENHLLKGYFQSWKYFDDPDIQGLIREEFRFQASVMSNAKLFIENVTKNYKAHFRDVSNHTDEYNNLKTAPGKEKPGSKGSIRAANQLKLVGIHVRRGDLTASYTVQKGFTMAPVSYIHKAMRYFETKYSSNDLVFIICSDTIEWVEKNVRSQKSPIVLSKNQSGPVDLAVLTLCDDIIMTVGTFGWWAGWLAGGTTVYWKEYPKPKSTIAAHFNHIDYYPKNWIAMTA